MRSLLAVATSAVLTLACVAVTASPARAQSLEIADATAVATVDVLSVKATVEEGVALVDVEQTFRNTTNTVQEGIWKIRLPEDSVVHTFSMWMDGREKQGRVMEAAHARRVYDEIVRGRKDPALLEETGWREFRVSVFPIPARGTVKVRLRYAHVVADDLGLHDLALPLPAAGAEIAALDVAADVTSTAGLAVLDAPGATSARIERSEIRGSVRWSAERTRPTGPFHVRFAAPGRGFQVALLTHRGPDDDSGTFVARVVPRLDAPPDLPRDVVFVIDTSGSMEGTKLVQAKRALDGGIASLRAEDRFAVVSFASELTRLTGPALVTAGAEQVAAARAAVAKLESTGGTNIAGALDAAANLLRAPAAVSAQVVAATDTASRLACVVFLTDGDPTVGITDPNQIVANWRTRSGRELRLFALGVGEGVKDFLLTRLADGSRGTAQYVRDDGSLEIKLSALLQRLRTPLLTAPELRVEGTSVNVLSVEPHPLPDVFRGGTVVLAGRFTGSGDATIVLSGRSGATPVEVRVPVTFPAAPVARPHVAQLWARSRIDRLLEDLRAAGTASAEIRDEIVRLGLRYQVVSPYTSFLVVEDGVRIADDRDTARVPDAPGSGSTASGSRGQALGNRPTAGPTSGGGGDPGGPTTGGGGGGGPTTGGGGGGGPTTSGRPSSGGHGGDPGPSGEVPPDSREPGDPPPPPDGGGPGTPGGSNPGSQALGGKKLGGGTKGPGYDHWRFWWEYESEALLAARRPFAGPRVDLAQAAPDVVDTLRELARRPSEPWFVRAHAVEALARARDPEAETRSLVARLQRRDEPANGPLVERAILASAWMDDRTPETLARLRGVLGDTARTARERSFAALTLGALGESDGGHVTDALLAVAAAPNQDVRCSAIAALGLLGDPAATDRLLGLLDAAPPSGPAETERAWIVASLGRLAANDTPRAAKLAPRFRAMLGDDREAQNVARALPRALERLFGACDAIERQSIVAALRRCVEHADDPSTRHEAVLATGRIAGSPECDPATAARCRQWLIGLAAKGRQSVPAYARIALGFSGDAKAIAGTFADAPAEKAPFALGPYAITALVSGDRPSSATLLDWAMRSSVEPGVRGLAALALAASGDPSAVPAVRLLETEFGAELPCDAVRAIGYCGDAADRRVLLDTFRNYEASQHVMRRAAWSLARIGDVTTARALEAIAKDEKRYPDMTRGHAIEALGRMGARSADPFLRLVDGFAYRAYDPALAELVHLVADPR